MGHKSVSGWRGHIESGRKFLKTARNGRARPAVFTPDLIYQLTAMAVENFLAGLWQYHNQMPADHTLEGLVDGLARICPLEKDLAEGVKALGRFDDMCPVAPVKHCAPTGEQITAMLAVAGRLAAFTGHKVRMSIF